MKSGHILSSLGALAAVASAKPTPPEKETGRLATGALSSASGCTPWPSESPLDPYLAYEPCCIPDYCWCRNGWFYLFNPENKKAGGNGCDPPWGFMGKTLEEFPGFCAEKLGCKKGVQ
ncbi:hypothetical protein X797_003504 [Metarhizium robertsii]|uniref:Uncharacterized protein n=1 Tax=Metarhizium robertsii TaxID=568076 RepID=A0A0A1V1H3_9HYPO|nr:hypothetical protein X797_003504 [Metarhizium robertsii]